MRPSQRLAQAFRKTLPRFQQAPGAVAGKPPQTVFRRLWESEVGIKTVHFWAPVLKWGLVIAGIGDFARPVENLSFSQNFALMCTGIIWTRWCLIIKPKNYFVNFCLGCVGLAQVGRITMYNQAQKKKGPIESEVDKLKEKTKQVLS